MANSSYLTLQDATEDLTSITHSVNSGTFTSLTDEEDIFTRSPSDSYYFESDPFGQTHTLLLEYSSNKTIRDVVLLAVSDFVSAVRYQLLDASNFILFTGEYDGTAQKLRYLFGEPMFDYLWAGMPVTSGVRKIKITFITTTSSKAITNRIGFFGISEVPIEFSIAPKSAGFNPEARGSKLETNGGQVHAGTMTTVEAVRFVTRPISEYDLSIGFKKLNQTHSTGTPFVFVPYENSQMFLYCTQTQPAAYRVVEAPPNNGPEGPELLFEVSCSFKEEL